MVDLYHTGKPRIAIIREINELPWAFDKWIHQSNLSGSFSEQNNLTDEQKEAKK